MSIHTARVITQTLDTIDQLGAPLPEPIRDAIDTAATHATAAADWTPPNGGLVTAAFDAITGNKNPLTDKQVTAAVVAEALHARQGEIRAIGHTRLADLARRHLDDIAASLSVGYQRHVTDPLTAAIATLARYGITEPDTPAEQVLRHGGEAAEAWNAVLEAKRKHHDILSRLTVLAATLNVSNAEPVFLYADAGTLTLHDVRRLGSKPEPWVAINAGMSLGLVSPAKSHDRQREASRNAEHQLADAAYTNDRSASQHLRFM